MSKIGKLERLTQNRVVKLFQEQLEYRYLGDWQEEERTQPIEEGLLRKFLIDEKGYSPLLADKAIAKFVQSASILGNGLYEANKKVYGQLRYGVNVREEVGEAKESVWLIDWENPTKNDFAIAEEVTFLGKHPKRPDIVIYINGIALGVIELKRSKVSLEEGIRQNIDNQSEYFIPRLFSTIQFTMAGNDTQGMRYGTVGTTEEYYLKWKEQTDQEYEYILDKHLIQFCNKERLIELAKDFVIFDKGIKKFCRPNQYFCIKAAQKRVLDGEGGILWHTQGSGKSLTMVWLTRWIRQNIDDSRILIITDREELDDQIEKLFLGVDESIYRTQSGRDLIRVLGEKSEMLVCSLVHKFGSRSDKPDYNAFIEEISESLPSNFKAQGDIYVFVDECHRTQSGKLNKAMKTILPEAMFIGFTGTLLLKKDKQKSIEIFGPYIGEPYKFDEAVEDGVVLDLLYEARDVEQFVTGQNRIDKWFDSKTSGLTDVAKAELKKKWGTMQKVLGSSSRLSKIVNDIIHDFDTKPRLFTGEGNAMLVSGSVANACKYYELFQQAGFKNCAIITSYKPHHADIKGEGTGETAPTEKLLKYEVYTKMLAGKSPEQFEEEVKEQFINEPGRMKLLIVVDKLLTGFDAPSATYLYIDKSMQDHGLFQAICRVNRVDTEDKEYGYVIDYKDLFKSLEKSIQDYTSGAFDEFDQQDVNGLLKDRHKESKERLDTALEALIAICEPVYPKNESDFIRYFCGDTEKKGDLKDTEEKRVTLYKAVVSLIRSYSNVANEMLEVGYTPQEAEHIKERVKYYSDLRDTIKRASGDYVDLKRFEPGMRQLMDRYIDASSSQKISDFENESLIDLIVHLQDKQEPYGENSQKAVAETIENNVRKVIIEESQVNPKYYEKMSRLLDELIHQRKNQALDYKEYLARIKALAQDISKPEASTSYPDSLETNAKRALYDNLDQNEVLTLALDNVIQANKLDGWRDGGIKERKLKLAIMSLLKDEGKTDEIMDIIKAQREY